ncbi:tetratricopeptide repeat protein [Actinoplanes sp. NPDC049265]|uniref:tetratricopeptide repeat protein n=1 Tax=Actinoplanes sp. NPDC049265 TaxID=3363902 RepID=UPI003718937C
MEESRQSADRDLAQARAAIERGEMRHAADHLAGAIAQAPTLPETHELLSRLAARSGGALELFPLEQNAFVGTVVARAHLLAAAGRPEDGLPLLFAASGHTPGRDWAGVPWVTDPSLGVKVEPGLLARNVMQLCTAIGDPDAEAARSVLRPYLTVVRHAIAAHPEHALLLGAGSALARRVGEPETAVDWAQRGARARPSKLAEIWLGYAYRSAGRVGEALAALRRAVTHDPEDLSVYADIAATLADAGRMDDALAWVERALAKDPSFDCAVHTAHRLRFRADGRLSHLVDLADFAAEHPDDTHEHTDLAECCVNQPWLGGVPEAARGTDDPRRRAPSSEPPTAAAVERLLRVARPAWPHPPAAYDAALGLVLVEPEQLLALLADPPGNTENDRRAALVWACLGLLHHDTDEGWMGSSRRRRLVELAVGGADAITEAAMFALVAYAWVDPAARTDVTGLITGRLMSLAGPSRKNRPPIAWSVAQLALATPDLADETREMAAAVAKAEEERNRPRIPRQRPRKPKKSRRQLLRWLTR